MTVELLHPRTRTDVEQTLRAASEAGTRVSIVGGRRHIDKGNPAEVDAELWTTQLDRVVAYEPAEMLVVVQSGMRCGTLASLLAEHSQEWPADAPPDATVGGVIASASSSSRRLAVGPLRDTVVEMELVTGDGRPVTSGARTVKNVTGYDVHRLMTGSLGTLGVITQVALKVRPLPERAVSVVAQGGFEVAAAIAAGVPRTAGVVATPGEVEVRVEGWSAEVDPIVASVGDLAGGVTILDGAPFPRAPWWTWPDAGTIAEAAVAPSRLAHVLDGTTRYAALAGVGLAWIGAASPDEVASIRARAASAGGIAPAVRGPGGLGDSPPAAPDVHRRLRASFDPAGILAPGRAWGSDAAAR